MGLLAEIFRRAATVRHPVELATKCAVLVSLVGILAARHQSGDHLCGAALAGFLSAVSFSRRLTDSIAFCTSVS